MVINNKKYVISTKGFPLKFNDENGNQVDNIEDAFFYRSIGEADDTLTYSYDKPEQYQIIKVDITYEF